MEAKKENTTNVLLKAKDLQQKHNWSKNKAYELIKNIKEKFKLTYPEMVVREDIYLRYFES